MEGVWLNLAQMNATIKMCTPVQTSLKCSLQSASPIIQAGGSQSQHTHSLDALTLRSLTFQLCLLLICHYAKLNNRSLLL